MAQTVPQIISSAQIAEHHIKSIKISFNNKKDHHSYDSLLVYYGQYNKAGMPTESKKYLLFENVLKANIVQCHYNPTGKLVRKISVTENYPQNSKQREFLKLTGDLDPDTLIETTDHSPKHLVVVKRYLGQSNRKPFETIFINYNKNGSVKSRIKKPGYKTRYNEPDYEISATGRYQIKYKYNKNGLLISEVTEYDGGLNNHVKIEYTYDDKGQLTRKATAGITENLEAYYYSNGQCVRTVFYLAGQKQKTVYYTYDAQQRLSQYKTQLPNGEQKRITYTYNSQGLLVAETHYLNGPEPDFVLTTAYGY